MDKHNTPEMQKLEFWKLVEQISGSDIIADDPECRWLNARKTFASGKTCRIPFVDGPVRYTMKLAEQIGRQLADSFAKLEHPYGTPAEASR